MSEEIPEDIVIAATTVLNEWANSHNPRPGPIIARAIFAERQSHTDAIAAKDREIAEIRQRTIEECIEAVYAFIERDKDAQVIPYIAAAIRSLGKEGSGE